MEAPRNAESASTVTPTPLCDRKSERVIEEAVDTVRLCAQRLGYAP
jgi:hypothetical protein